MCNCDCETPSKYAEAHPVARKPHRCCECRETIPVGAKYQNVSGLWDGRYAHFKTCGLCEELRGKLEKESKDCICFGGLREWCGEMDVKGVNFIEFRNKEVAAAMAAQKEGGGA